MYLEVFCRCKRRVFNSTLSYCLKCFWRCRGSSLQFSCFDIFLSLVLLFDNYFFRIRRRNTRELSIFLAASNLPYWWLDRAFWKVLGTIVLFECICQRVGIKQLSIFEGELLDLQAEGSHPFLPTTH